MVVVSLVAMFLVSAVIIFIVGFLCGQWFGKRTLNQAPSTHPQKGPPGPIYESMLPSPIHEEQPIELEENVAYGPSTANL